MDTIINYIDSLFWKCLSFITTDKLVSWFVYDPNNPLLFNSSLFLGFFLVFYLIYIITKKHEHFRTAYVLLFSLFFYYKAGNNYFILILSLAIVNFILSETMDLCQRHLYRKLFLILIVVCDLLVLGYYKYTGFLFDNINLLFSKDFRISSIILPIGISFFIFQAISYAVDLYHRRLSPARNVLDYAFYLCFFPQIIAGPIVRAKDFLPQMYSALKLSKENAGVAFYLIICGLIKKAVISDYISQNFVDRIFDNPLSYTSFENWMATYGYTLQIFCDFSGYSDMAIGLALLMGFRLPENFRTPYKSRSMTEFWHRWHMSLSSWLRDYLYIPLGGNRKGRLRTYLNLFLTMLIGGLWHGAAWTYVIWGGLHGLALTLERFFKQYIRLPEKNILINFICTLVTFHFVVFCWIFFRSADFNLARTMIENISRLELNFEVWGIIISAYKNIFLVICIGYMLHFLPIRLMNATQNAFCRLPFIIQSVILGFVFWLVYATATSGAQPFIYFQF